MREYLHACAFVHCRALGEQLREAGVAEGCVEQLHRLVVHRPKESDDVVEIGGAAAGADECFVERWGLKGGGGGALQHRRDFGLVLGKAACRVRHDLSQVWRRDDARSPLVVEQAPRDAKRSGPFTEAGGGDVREQEFGGILVAEGVRELAGLEEQGATLGPGRRRRGLRREPRG